jgi:hypothetical protein
MYREENSGLPSQLAAFLILDPPSFSMLLVFLVSVKPLKHFFISLPL